MPVPKPETVILEMVEPVVPIPTFPFELVAYCLPELECKDIVFYYFPLDIKLSEDRVSIE